MSSARGSASLPGVREKLDVPKLHRFGEWLKGGDARRQRKYCQRDYARSGERRQAAERTVLLVWQGWQFAFGVSQIRRDDAEFGQGFLCDAMNMGLDDKGLGQEGERDQDRKGAMQRIELCMSFPPRRSGFAFPYKT
jgi:hypothetical protein